MIDDLPAVSQAVRSLNPDLFPPEPDRDTPPMPAVVSAQSERDLQAAVECELMTRGYYRMTVSNFNMTFSGKINPRGFYGHWIDCQRGPTICDILVVSWPVARPPLLLELKVRQVFQPGQKAAISLKLWRLAWCFEEAKAIIEAWEKTP